jgi:hypothetical protein
VVESFEPTKHLTVNTQSFFLFPTQRSRAVWGISIELFDPRLCKNLAERKKIYIKEDTQTREFVQTPKTHSNFDRESLNFAKWVRTDTCSCRLFSQPSLLLLLLLPCTKDVPRERAQTTTASTFHSWPVTIIALFLALLSLFSLTL